jgi:hypothetical protein
MTIYEDSEKRIEELLKSSESAFRRRFIDTVQEIDDSNTLAEIIVLLEAGKLDEALVAVELAAANIAYTYSDVYTASGKSAANFISNSLKILVNFDQTNQAAVDEMAANQLRIIRNFTDKQRLATKAALLDGIKRGLNPRQTALLFKASIGLTETQVGWVLNFQRLLEDLDKEVFKRLLRDRRFDSTIARAIQNQEPLSQSQIDRMVNRYRDRVLSYRAETIARTESLAAVHQGTDNMYFQAISDGILDENNMEQTWKTASDERVRGSHRPMNGQKRKMGEAFTSGLGNSLRYPGDPEAPVRDRIDCRCIKITRFIVVTG